MLAKDIAILIVCSLSPSASARNLNPGYLEAVASCHAGCQGNTAGCQKSKDRAVFNAPIGYRILRDSKALVSWKDGVPGLVREPQWIVETYPLNSDRVAQMTIRPDTRSCEGRSGDTQGGTYYTWRVSIEKQ